MVKQVYSFGGGRADGNAGMKQLLGGKGANLAEMSALGLPVPPGFTITTEVCNKYLKEHQLSDELEVQVCEAVKLIEEEMGARLGDSANPLLLSCRSGARASMPGMMDTVLNIGCNDMTVLALAEISGDKRFAWDSYRRFVQMYGEFVLGVRPNEDEPDPFDAIIHKAKQDRNVTTDAELMAVDWQQVTHQFIALIEKQTGQGVPQDPRKQLFAAIESVFKSWGNPRAAVYRDHYHIPNDWGTACNIQAMIFGNLGRDCATGVALTRNGSDGEPGLCGDYLVNAQGEDVVAGVRHPKHIEKGLAKEMPEAYKDLAAMATQLEKHFRDMQDLEFTIQHGKVWILQTRNAKRTAAASLRVAVDLVDEGLISSEEAIGAQRVPPDALEHLLQPVFENEALLRAEQEGRLLTKGVAASPGAAAGMICLSADRLSELVQSDPMARFVLVRQATSADDIHGMKVAAGVITSFGGTSSHAALVSRQMGRPCVVGCRDLDIDMKSGTIRVNDTVYKEGDELSLDGFTGNVFGGLIETEPSELLAALQDPVKARDAPLYRYFSRLMEWADRTRQLGVRANADKPTQVEVALALGAEGIGLCRTEHMFFDHVDKFRAMIVAESDVERQRALDELLPLQRADFLSMFRVMGDRPLTIRLLDPPLHEFLPQDEVGLQRLAEHLGKDASAVVHRARALKESNPMLGNRGVRLAIVYSEIPRMQSRAIFEAACLAKSEGLNPHPEVMIPLVFTRRELDIQADVIREVAEEVFREQGCKVEYRIGSMIEVPRAALVANEIAQTAEFFSFGTNDLTQTTLGMSRDDSGTFLPLYQQQEIVSRNPFRSVDQAGVGQLVQIGTERGRAARPGLTAGICGEHGGDPESIQFFHRASLDYVSCSPFRIPVARLAAAQAALESSLERGLNLPLDG